MVAAPYSTADKLSFAYPSATERWPVIIVGAIDNALTLISISLTCIQTQGIDDVHRSTSAATDPAVVEEGKRIVSDLAKLKYELQHGRQLTYVLPPILHRQTA